MKQITHSPQSSFLDLSAQRACLRVAPLFDRRDMVAVNPFLGFLEQEFFQAMLTSEAIFHEPMLPAVEDGAGRPSPAGPQVQCVADALAESLPEHVARAPRTALLRFLGARVAQEQPLLYASSGLFEGYLGYAKHDRSVDLAGIKGFRSFMTESCRDVGEVFRGLSSQLGESGQPREEYFFRLLAQVPGYAGLLRAEKFSSDPRALGQLPELLTILLLQDFALAELSGRRFGPSFVPPAPGYLADRSKRLSALERHEQDMLRQLKLILQAPAGEKPSRPSAQLAFCIDVRSERFCRQLERQAEDLSTFGVAGFFGLPVSIDDGHGHRPHCPPLLSPSWSVALSRASRHPMGASVQDLSDSFSHALSSPISALCHVEAWGLSYVPRLLAYTFAQGKRAKTRQTGTANLSHLPLEDLATWAKGFLGVVGFGPDLAPLAVVVGHGSVVTNNPQAAGLACGACAGHSGAENARIAVSILNDPRVRKLLEESGCAIDESVWFVAAEHDTMTDEVTILDRSAVPPSHQEGLAQLERQLAQATAGCQAERAPNTPGLKSKSRKAFSLRANDFAETQPEWGLAGNAAFFIGDRRLCRGGDLGGRAFLHSYDEQLDEDGKILEAILTAPAVVGSWINLQYYASTVAPAALGAGKKTLHNLVGPVGIVEGGEGDLVVGLSQESLFCQGREVHEPLRLHVLVQASQERVTDIISRSETLSQLVSGSWMKVSLVRVLEGSVEFLALDPDRFRRRESPIAAE